MRRAEKWDRPPIKGACPIFFNNAIGIPDSCDFAWGDLGLDGVIGPSDLGLMIANWDCGG
jgi:hypothetical protein